MKRCAAILAALVLGGTGGDMAHAGAVQFETAEIGKSEVRLYLHDFLTEEELTTLRLVMSNPDALQVFTQGKDGFTALAVSPDEGFIRDMKPVESAKALADFPSAEEVEAAVLKDCNAARKGKADCVLVLTVAPKT